MNIKIEEVNAPDEWALNICKALSVNTYYNPEGGVSFFDVNKYKKENISLKFLKSIACLVYVSRAKLFIVPPPAGSAPFPRAAISPTAGF